MGTTHSGGQEAAEAEASGIFCIQSTGLPVATEAMPLLLSQKLWGNILLIARGHSSFRTEEWHGTE